MSDASTTNQPQSLRRDLRGIAVRGGRRDQRIVMDDIAGRFARISEHLWQALSQGQDDPALWHQAHVAGWTREREPAVRKHLSLLYFRVPVGSVDRLARLLAPVSGIVFSPTAVLLWCSVIALAALLAVSRVGELASLVGSLGTLLEQSTPVWLAAVFIGTKTIHELGHAVMCRRLGSRCGDWGILFLAGMPCPYCDVTDIWRHPSALRRAAVMSAGIYLELIVAAVATLICCSATDLTVRLHALNLMIVCGISTLIFNANPLMRYDGYFVLCDLVGSVNLRQEARDAFHGVVTARVAGPGYRGSRRNDRRAVALTCFHTASFVYRIVIAVAITALVLAVAQYFHMRTLARGLILLGLIAAAVSVVRRLVNVTRGQGHWTDVPTVRRLSLSGAAILLLILVLLVPTPRYCSADGQVDASGATTVFLPADGLVRQVMAEIGDRVDAGQPILRVQDESIEIQQAKLRGQLRVASLRNSMAHQVALGDTELSADWRTLQAAENAIGAQLASVQRRSDRTNVQAPIGGLILPARAMRTASESTRPPTLRGRVGTAVTDERSWCRISADGSLDAILVIDARDRRHIDVETPVRVSLAHSPQDVIHTRVVAVSPIANDEASISRVSAFEVVCPLGPLRDDQVLPSLGQQCRGVFHLPPQTLLSNLAHSISEWFSGS